MIVLYYLLTSNFSLFFPIYFLLYINHKAHLFFFTIAHRIKSGNWRPIKDKQSNTLTTEEKKEERWMVYFNEVMNRPLDAENEQEILQLQLF